MTIRRTLIAALAFTGVLAATAAAAQSSRQLEPGVARTSTLNAQNVSQVFTYQSEGGESGVITATNELGVPLAITVNDSAGEPVTQGVDADIDGELIVDDVAFDAADIYYVTVFKAGGIASVAEVQFEVVLDILPAEAAVTPEPTVATAESTAEPAQPTAIPAETTVEAPASGIAVTTSGISVTLAWDSGDDLDLEVRDPVGGSLYWRTPTVNSGGSLSPNLNQGCVTPVSPAAETATWPPGGVPTGSYEILVYFQESCNDGTAAAFTLTPVVDGLTLGPIEASLTPGGIFVVGFTVNNDGSAQLNNDGGVYSERGLAGLSAPEILASAQPIEVGSSVTGVITNAQPFASWVFQGEADLLYNISVQATSGSLDTFVAVLDANGNIIRENDDAAVGNTNSELLNMLLPSAGPYTIFVSRYAKTLGATEGAFTLSLTSSDLDLPQDFTATIPDGSLQILLLWNNNTDLQLLVRDPAGDAVYDDVPEIRSGGRLGASGNVNCTQADGAPFSLVYWPVEIPPRAGSYEAEVWFQNECNDTTQVTATLYIIKDQQTVATFTFIPLLDERFLTSFEISDVGVLTPGPGGIIRGAEDLDYATELDSAAELVRNVAATGTITPSNRFDVFTFEGAAGDVVNIAMNNTSGSLDPTLYLVSPSGVVIASNDDAVAGENTNSLIANFTLPEDGQYIIIATHFGGPYGGTTGTYSLTISQLN